MNNKCRILIISNSWLEEPNGISCFIMNLYREMDHSLIQFDVVCYTNKINCFDEELENFGGSVVQLIPKSNNKISKWLEKCKLLLRYIRSNDYAGVYMHSAVAYDAFYLLLIKLFCKCPVRILHSHSSGLTKMRGSNFRYVLNSFSRQIIVPSATKYFACSDKAMKWMYPKRIYSKVDKINNAIDLEKYFIQSNVRFELRKELQLENSFVVGHVGRFSWEKNHEFLLEIFKTFSKRYDNSKLLLVGEGVLKENIVNKCKELGILEKVNFIGATNEVSKYLAVMDVFVMPSFFEGLPIVGVEAQASGLKMVVSDSISKELNLTNNVLFAPLNNNIAEWCKLIASCMTPYNREQGIIDLKQKGYDIKGTSIKVQNIILESMKSEGNW